MKKELNGLYVQPSCLQNNSREFCLLFTRLCHVQNVLKVLNKIEIFGKKNNVPGSISVVSNAVCSISFHNSF